ncbi:DUF1610 domain-containing protein [Candidatus Woesearchaeota archaeon]|nr:DUF1610 domain-containing protein [Candidatus Woesearchaeota archaeon]
MVKKEKVVEEVVLDKPVLEEVKAESKLELKEENLIDISKEQEIRLIPVGSVIFPCPNCGKTTVSRTFSERRLATPYKCENCSFVGPN